MASVQRLASDFLSFMSRLNWRLVCISLAPAGDLSLLVYLSCAMHFIKTLLLAV